MSRAISDCGSPQPLRDCRDAGGAELGVVGLPDAWHPRGAAPLPGLRPFLHALPCRWRRPGTATPPSKSVPALSQRGGVRGRLPFCNRTHKAGTALLRTLRTKHQNL